MNTRDIIDTMNTENMMTKRLQLIPFTRELCEFEQSSRIHLSKALQARVPDAWPPALMDADTIQEFRERLSDPLQCSIFAFYWVKMPDSDDANRVLIGSGGFFLDPEGMFELGYSVLPEFQNRGYATEAVACLISWVFTHYPIPVITATTCPDLLPSIRVLEKNFFVCIGKGREEGTVAFERTRLPGDTLVL